MQISHSSWLYVFGCIILHLTLYEQCGATFKFVEFAYKETKKNVMTTDNKRRFSFRCKSRLTLSFHVSKQEIIFGEFESACQQSTVCASKRGIDSVNCIRECVSPFCYSLIYKHDEVNANILLQLWLISLFYFVHFF